MLVSILFCVGYAIIGFAVAVLFVRLGDINTGNTFLLTILLWPFGLIGLGYTLVSVIFDDIVKKIKDFKR